MRGIARSNAAAGGAGHGGLDGRPGREPRDLEPCAQAGTLRRPRSRGIAGAGAGLVLAAMIAACGPGSGPGGDATATEDSRVATGAGDFDPSLPAHSPGRFGFGRAASEERIALWDIDIKPDGEGLPPGSGSVAEGQVIYERACMQCHGPTGTEGPNDRLVATGSWEDWPPGRAIGAFWPWATTIFDYTRRAMPQLEPGTLTANDTYAMVAYILHLNELLPADAVLDASSLAAIEMPARDRFVPDDRTGGTEIRQ